jgi:hypothetical protein
MMSDIRNYTSFKKLIDTPMSFRDYTLMTETLKLLATDFNSTNDAETFIYNEAKNIFTDEEWFPLLSLRDDTELIAMGKLADFLKMPAHLHLMIAAEILQRYPNQNEDIKSIFPPNMYENTKKVAEIIVWNYESTDSTSIPEYNFLKEL